MTARTTARRRSGRRSSRCAASAVGIEPRTTAAATPFRKGLTRPTARAASQGLLAVNLWYGHPKTSVLLVDTPLPEGEWTNLQPYGGRGWCRMEQRASAMVKASACLISLSALTGEEKHW